MKCLLTNRIAFPMSRADVHYSVSILQVISKSTSNCSKPQFADHPRKFLMRAGYTGCKRETEREHLEAQELHNYVL